LKGDYTYQQKNLSDDAKSLIKGLINLEPQKRLTVPQILVHPWLKETKDGDSSSDDEEAPEEAKGEGKNDIGGKTSDIDLTNIQGNVNYVNVDNLFYHENYKTKLSYTDYCCITEDFTSENIDEEALKVCENFGYPR
jgi:serine/threonine protein kinase